MTRLRDELLGLAGRPGLRVSVVRTGALGDTMLVLPALSLIHRALAPAEVTMVGSRWAERLTPLLADPWTFVPFDSQAMASLFAPEASDDPTGTFRQSDLALIYTAERATAFVKNVHKLCKGRVIEWPTTPAPGLHAACHFAAAVTAGAPDVADLPFPGVRISDEARARATRWLSQHVAKGADPIAVVHPGSGSERKCWPTARFTRLVEELGKLGMRAVLLKGPADERRCSAVADGLSVRLGAVVAEIDDIQVVSALISRASIFVGNDSGVSHLAAASGAPTVVIFGPTDPSVWRPLGPSVKVVQGEQSARNRAAWPTLETVLDAAKTCTRVTGQ